MTKQKQSRATAVSLVAVQKFRVMMTMSDEAEAVCVLDRLQELAAQNLSVRVRRKVEQVEARVRNRKVLFVNVHRLNNHLNQTHTRHSNVQSFWLRA